MFARSGQAATFDIRHPTFDIRRSTFDVRHPTFDVRHPTFDVRRSTFDIRRSTFDVRRSTFDVRHPKYIRLDARAYHKSVKYPRGSLRSRKDSLSFGLAAQRLTYDRSLFRVHCARPGPLDFTWPCDAPCTLHFAPSVSIANHRAGAFLDLRHNR